MSPRSRTAVAVGLLIFAFSALGATPPQAAAYSWVWPTTGRVTQWYGCTGFYLEPRYGDCRHFHRGIDIANSRWTPIWSATSGVVKYVGWNPYERCCDRAWVVWIADDNGTKAIYGHMVAKYVRGAKKGDRVRAGQLIGYMGATGHATGPHLHFQLERNGVPVSPLRFLDGRPRLSGSAPSTAMTATSVDTQTTPAATAKAKVFISGGYKLGVFISPAAAEGRRYPLAL